MNQRSLLEGEKAARDGILYLLFLAVLKLIAGLLSGMTVVIADGINTFSDTLGIFAAYIGLKISRKHADGHFSYGYYKIETLAALIISIGIIYLSYLLFIESITNFEKPEEGQYRMVALITTVIAIIYSYFLGKKLQIAGEKANSLSLIASAKDKKMDILAGFAVLLS